jgi:hypothetical protein
MDNLESIMKGHAEIMRTGLKHGGDIALGKVVDEINRLIDLKGLSGDWHAGYRKALMDVRAFILASLKPPTDDEEAYHTSTSPAEEYERVERMRADNARKLQADFERAMAPDYSRKGIFQTHNCAYCLDGELPCRQGAVNRCDNPRARND